MILFSEAQAAAQNVVNIAGDITFGQLMQLANLILIPIAGFIYRMDRKITKALEWMAGHDKLDDARFKAFEQRHNSMDTAMQAVIDTARDHTASAGLKKSA